MPINRSFSVFFLGLVVVSTAYGQSEIVGSLGRDYSASVQVDRGISATPAVNPQAATTGTNIQVVDGLIQLPNQGGIQSYQAGVVSPVTVQPQTPVTQVQMPSSLAPRPTPMLSPPNLTGPAGIQ